MSQYDREPVKARYIILGETCRGNQYVIDDEHNNPRVYSDEQLANQMAERLAKLNRGRWHYVVELRQRVKYPADEPMWEDTRQEAEVSR